jgi:uncharacterized protein
MARIILGGGSISESFGNSPPVHVFVETDGQVEGLDCLRVCKDGMTATNMNVRDTDFQEIFDKSRGRSALFEGMPLPQACRTCHKRETCAGGYLPHRYSRAHEFDNPSVWCADYLKLFTHLRNRLGVTVKETGALRLALRRVNLTAPA